jgi:ribosomal protein S7
MISRFELIVNKILNKINYSGKKKKSDAIPSALNQALELSCMCVSV